MTDKYPKTINVDLDTWIFLKKANFERILQTRKDETMGTTLKELLKVNA